MDLRIYKKSTNNCSQLATNTLEQPSLILLTSFFIFKLELKLDNRVPTPILTKFGKNACQVLEALLTKHA